MISHYATQGPGQHLLPGLEEATSDDNHLCSSVYSHSQTMTDLGSNTVENIRSEISSKLSDISLMTYLLLISLV